MQDDQDAVQRRSVLRRLYVASILCTLFIIVEVVGGYLAHSLAIMSDAAHLFADLASFLIAIVASNLASLPATKQYTFGLKRTESLAAFFSMASLAVVCAGLAYESIKRLWLYAYDDNYDGKVDGILMSGIASIGIVVNIVLAIVLGEHHIHMPGLDDHGGHDHDHGHGDHDDGDGEDHQHAHDENGNEIDKEDHGHDHDHSNTEATDNYALLPTEDVPTTSASHDGDRDTVRNVNLQAAYLHVMADLVQSVVVLIAGIVIWIREDWCIIDPILTLVFSVLVGRSTIGVMKHSLSILLESTPNDISYQKLHDAILSLPGITDIHELHIWSISDSQPALTVHCLATPSSDSSILLSKIKDVCVKSGINHSTIQIQTGEGPCITCDTQNIGSCV